MSKFFKPLNLCFALILLSFFNCQSDTSDEPEADTTEVEICADGIDNDGDGLIDCFDSDCDDNANCQEICGDGIDNDNDGFTDCEDLDCEEFIDCLIERCIDGIDNDGDGLIDCDDPDCDTNPNCT